MTQRAKGFSDFFYHNGLLPPTYGYYEELKYREGRGTMTHKLLVNGTSLDLPVLLEGQLIMLCLFYLNARTPCMLQVPANAESDSAIPRSQFQGSHKNLQILHRYSPLRPDAFQSPQAQFSNSPIHPFLFPFAQCCS